MERCANTEAMDRHLAKQEEDEAMYELMLDELRDASADEYDNIIDYWGYADADYQDIIKDI